MQKICVNRYDNMVNQIFDLSDYPEFNPEHYPYCYVVDDEAHEITHYGYRYNLELETFEIVEGFEEEETEVLPSDTEIKLREEIAKKDKEILELKIATAEIVEANEAESLELKIAMAEMSEEKDAEILKLKLALAELVEGGI